MEDSALSIIEHVLALLIVINLRIGVTAPGTLGMGAGAGASAGAGSGTGAAAARLMKSGEYGDGGDEAHVGDRWKVFLELDHCDWERSAK